MTRHIIINMESPLMAFGGETIDNYGVIRRFPAASMLTGIFANALGWRRIERQKHQALQDRLVFATRIEREPAGGVSMTDFQTAQLDKNDKGWTTRGVPEGRAGGANTYNAPHLRWRDYFADMRVCVALRLRPAAASPTLDGTSNTDAAFSLTLEILADALQQPKRALFIGRKPCLPAVPMFGGFTDEGDTALAALLATPLECAEDAPPSVAMQWHDGEGVDTDSVRISRSLMLTDERNWISGLHGGGRLVHEGSADKTRFRAQDADHDCKDDHCEKDGEA